MLLAFLNFLVMCSFWVKSGALIVLPMTFWLLAGLCSDPRRPLPKEICKLYESPDQICRPHLTDEIYTPRLRTIFTKQIYRPHFQERALQERLAPPKKQIARAVQPFELWFSMTTKLQLKLSIPWQIAGLDQLPQSSKIQDTTANARQESKLFSLLHAARSKKATF